MRTMINLDPSKLQKLDTLEGTRSENIEKAVDIYLFLLETYQLLEDSIVKINKMLFSYRNKKKRETRMISFCS
jgi:hypothetical protein